MRREIVASFAATTALLLLAAPASAVSLLGTELQLRTHAQSTPTSELFVTSFPASATVSETEVEFPDVASLFDPTTGVPPGFANSLVDVAIDAGSDFLTIDFDNSAPFTQFAVGFQNTYVFTFDSAVALAITSAVIDEEVTTLGLTPQRVTFEGNELFVNVQGLSFNPSTFARINLTAAETPIGPPAEVIPLPAAMPLMLAAFAVLGLVARRRTSA